jgi:hypothetical protein
MSNELKATGTLVGGNNFAAFEINNLFYRASDIVSRQKIIFPYLNADQSYKVNLENQLKYALLISSMTIDVTLDDTTSNENVLNTNQTSPVTNLYIKTIDKTTNKTIDTTVYTLNNPYASSGKEIIIDPRYLYQFRVNRDVNNLVFIGKPVYLFPSIVIDGVMDRTDLPSSQPLD